MRRHNRIVDLISKDVTSFFGPSSSLHKYSTVDPGMFSLCSDGSDVLSNISANTPDVVFIMENSREVCALQAAAPSTTA